MAAQQQDNEYVLRRDYAASARLNLQHYQMKETIGYLLHPDIRVSEGMRIADIACGTGMWLLDLSSEVPESVTLEGFDISDDQFPHMSYLPKNIKLKTLDATGPVPEELVGRYDVVHVALLTLVVKDGEPGVWIRNLMSMLEQGGYLQWQEGNMPAHIARQTASPSSPTDFPHMHAFEQYHLNTLSMQPPGINDWITELGERFEKHGLKDVKQLTYEVPRKYWRAWTETLLLIVEEFADRLDNAGLREVVKRAGAELKKGAVRPNLMPIIVIGRKGV
ncbi:S-adenosyl-L-methionine-dependent methyltransferase [Lepidopterella palustris CBS 459.81]|uniref:S-adenosyl-L-methionine-dependent methyltransferase n=1 Tax=Lepidopterella palustris CBS 459.81 TaxID=1314670 RepID=A0A8E2E4D8_9PEZI|nr:S-adenosyl-L-methionine-dependent methyltransferase [Lepidopterella palustris CBS 459.81]